MQEELFAAEQLEVWVLHPAFAHRLVAEIVCVLEDRQSGHQPGRQRRHAGAVAVDLTTPVFDCLP